MPTRYLILFVGFFVALFGGVMWSANHYHEKFLEEQSRAADAEQRADSSAAITANVLRTVAITNIILETNLYAKQQIALESQRAQADIKAALKDDDCAIRPVPAAAADRMRKYADSVRTSSGGAAAREPDS